MSQEDRRAVTPDIASLRALSHPTRLRILTHLRTEGPATATMLGTRFGLHSGATSYHLRQLADHGFVVEDPDRGNARERWWRAAHEQIVTRSSDATTQEAKDASDAFWRSAALMYAERLQAAMDERPTLPTAWRNASTVSNWTFDLPAGRAEHVVQQIRDLLASISDEPGQDAEQFTIQVQAFPIPGHVTPAS